MDTMDTMDGMDTVDGMDGMDGIGGSESAGEGSIGDGVVSDEREVALPEGCIFSCGGD
ncbi:MAG TPA: hypothetical protein VE641_09035 [Chthoniobacterales bacterium]|nr:hypothetical protein [Chthoniobacterales bacterium]